jgi:hypothetical protein
VVCGVDEPIERALGEHGIGEERVPLSGRRRVGHIRERGWVIR